MMETREPSIVFDLGIGPLNQEPFHIEVHAHAKRQAGLLPTWRSRDGEQTLGFLEKVHRIRSVLDGLVPGTFGQLGPSCLDELGVGMGVAAKAPAPVDRFGE
jgi:hypothetical protein